MMKLLATCTSLFHLAFILFVILGAFWTRRRPFWTVAHLLALIWGIIVDVGPWPCPLTAVEQYLQTRAGLQTLQGTYVLHCLDATIYPNLPYWAVALGGVAVCAINLGIYGWRGRTWLRQRRG